MHIKIHEALLNCSGLKDTVLELSIELNSAKDKNVCLSLYFETFYTINILKIINLDFFFTNVSS